MGFAILNAIAMLAVSTSGTAQGCALQDAQVIELVMEFVTMNARFLNVNMTKETVAVHRQ